MNWLNLAMGGIGGLSSLFGGNPADKYRRMMEDAMSSYSRGLNEGENGMALDTLRGLYGLSGASGDALRSSGAALGDALAGSGVYNSSALAGALANEQRGADSSLAQMAQAMDSQRRQYHAQGQQNLANMQMNYAMPMYRDAQNQYANSMGGLQHWLQTLTQSNALGSGLHAQRSSMPPVNGLVNAGNGYMPDWAQGAFSNHPDTPMWGATNVLNGGQETVPVYARSGGSNAAFLNKLWK